MKTSWTARLQPEQQKEVIDAFKSSALLRNRLKVILEGKEAATIKAKVSDSEFENPSWAYKQADLGGYIRALEEVISLITEKI